ncbi:MAG: cytochrome b [Microvirga sp.]
MSPPVPASTGAGGRLSAGTLLLHWAVGLAVLGMLTYGFWLQTLPTGPGKAPWVQSHKSFGILVFALALVRIVWRWREGFPPPAGPHRAWERRAARGLHVFMIAATVLMPVSGILRSLAYARPVTVFGLPLIPKLFETKQELLYALSSTLHDGLAFALAGAIIVHIAAALRHQIRGDATLGRMLGGHGPDGLMEDR